VSTQKERIVEILSANGGSLVDPNGRLAFRLAEEIPAARTSVNTTLSVMRREGAIVLAAHSGSGTTGIKLAGAAWPTSFDPAAYGRSSTLTKGATGCPAPVASRPAADGAIVTPVVPITVAPAAAFSPVPWEMLWRERIPVGCLVVIAGPPGMGKSTLETAIAAELSQEGRVGIISNLEDDPESVITPRLMAAGADLSKVFLVQPQDAPKLPRELDRLAHLVRSSGASYLILDPIQAHFDPERRLHDRRHLATLMQLARETGCAIIGMHHTTKSGFKTNVSAIEAIGGPQGGLSGAARAVYLYGYDPEDEDRRCLACAKLNGLDRPPALIIEHEAVEVKAPGAAIEAGLLRFVEEAVRDTEDVLSRGQRHRSRDAEAVEWVSEFLADGAGCARPVGEVRSAARELEFSWPTILRAATTIGIERQKLGFGADGFWNWRLPDLHPLRQRTELAKTA
jgi:hypothetical protein